MTPSGKGAALRVLLLAAVTLSFVGFFVGVRQLRAPVPVDAVLPAVAAQDADAVPARTNRELATRPWSNDLEPWRPEVPRLEAAELVTTKDPLAKQRALELRRTRRAFEGAPPTIPHPVRQGSAKECLACHERGAMIGAARARPMSHKLYTQCTQCHVSAAGQFSPQDSFGPSFPGNTFAGTQDAPAPVRWSMAPPQVPHTTRMRDNCLACHGAAGYAGLHTSHPERQSCTQCHASSAEVDLLPAPLGAQ